jgi:hypothetical protein
MVLGIKDCRTNLARILWRCFLALQDEDRRVGYQELSFCNNLLILGVKRFIR